MPRVALGMENGEHDNAVGFRKEVDGVRKAAENGPPALAPNSTELLRVGRDLIKELINLLLQFQSQTKPLSLIPCHRSSNSSRAVRRNTTARLTEGAGI